MKTGQTAMTTSRLPLAVGAISLLALAACQAPVPGQENTNATTGAAVGALIGAGVGALTGDNREESIRNAAIGAAIGGGLGAIGGDSLDRQEAELRAQLGSNVGLVNTGSQLIVTMPQDILFATNSATLSPALIGDLQDVARSLNNYPNTTVQVVGHTDSTGDAGFNQTLSEQRAQSVANVLISSGVAPQRVRVIGRGENQPIATNQTAEGRQQNRRVEIIITPNQ
jgi:outer membrane protein OmpA-like peptidoglycan-associated protein